jgi:nocardicin N-oxygenase
MISTLFIAGHENTAAALARGVYALLRHDQYSALCADQSLAQSAVEEILRCEMPSQSALLRVAAADLRLPEGEVIAQGEAVLACIPAANRDPAQFSDPERLDIRRDPNPHLSFGSGPHYCVGAALARLEMRVALEALTSRLPALRLDCAPENVRFTTASLIRAPVSLPVAW